MEKTYNIRQRHPSQLSIPSRQRAHSQGQGTLCGRLGQALRSGAYLRNLPLAASSGCNAT